MTDWMQRLRRHYDRARERFPEHELLLLFDIDGTIVDLRYMVIYVLRAYDDRHGTDHFVDLDVEDVTVHENQVDRLPRLRQLRPRERERVRRWYLERRWRPEALFSSHRPFEGVMEVIRWFQLQPRTSVGLNTGRPESLRAETRFLMNELGEAWKVEFPDELLFMNSGGWEEDVVGSKVAGVHHYQRLGYHVFGFVDNEPGNLEAVAAADGTDGVLLLHADTLFETRRDRLPAGSVSGSSYRVRSVATGDRLPRRVRYTWQAVNDRRSLRRFLDSRVGWAELDVRPGRSGERPALGPATRASGPADRGWRPLSLEEALDAIFGRRRSVKLHLHGGADLAARVAESVRGHGVGADRVAFRVEPGRAGGTVVEHLAGAFPEAWIEATAGEVGDAIFDRPGRARDRLKRWRSMGVTALSLSCDAPALGAVIDQLRDIGLGVDVHGAADAGTFLRAALLLPDSVTARFGGPGWSADGGASRKDVSAA